MSSCCPFRRIAFFVLSDPEQNKTPSQESLAALKEAGLGRRRVVFPNKNGNFEHFKAVLESEYEKFKSQDSVFEIMRAESGGTSRPLKACIGHHFVLSLSCIRKSTFECTTCRVFC